VARRFNHIYGREPDFEERVTAAISKMGKKNAKLYKDVRKRYQEKGEEQALETGKALLDAQQNISVGDKERLFGYLEGMGKIILPEPEAKLTKASKMPGLDGQKMSKSYGNTIGLREEPDILDKKIRTMPTDPARVRLTDPGDPEKCPVWELHKVYSDDKTLAWVNEGCRNAAFGCLDCKKPLIEAVQEEMAPIRERARQFENDRTAVRAIISEGSEAARDVARETLDDVVDAMRFAKK